MQTKVVSGAMDQMCAGVGAGNIVPGIITESTGTCRCRTPATTREPIIDFATKVPCQIHAVPGMYCLLPWSPTGGMVLKWFKDRFARRRSSARLRPVPMSTICSARKLPACRLGATG